MEKKMSITEKAKGLLWNNGYIVGLYQAYLKLHSEYPNKNLMIIDESDAKEKIKNAEAKASVLLELLPYNYGKRDSVYWDGVWDGRERYLNDVGLDRDRLYTFDW